MGRSVTSLGTPRLHQLDLHAVGQDAAVVHHQFEPLLQGGVVAKQNGRLGAVKERAQETVGVVTAVQYTHGPLVGKQCVFPVAQQMTVGKGRSPDRAPSVQFLQPKTGRMHDGGGSGRC